MRLETTQQREPHEILAEVAHRKVRSLVNENGEHAEALFSVIYKSQPNWTMQDWEEALREIDASALTVREWLALQAYIQKESGDKPRDH